MSRDKGIETEFWIDMVCAWLVLGVGLLIFTMAVVSAVYVSLWFLVVIPLGVLVVLMGGVMWQDNIYLHKKAYEWKEWEKKWARCE